MYKIHRSTFLYVEPQYSLAPWLLYCPLQENTRAMNLPGQWCHESLFSLGGSANHSSSPNIIAKGYRAMEFRDYPDPLPAAISAVSLARKTQRRLPSYNIEWYFIEWSFVHHSWNKMQVQHEARCCLSNWLIIPFPHLVAREVRGRGIAQSRPLRPGLAKNGGFFYVILANQTKIMQQTKRVPSLGYRADSGSPISLKPMTRHDEWVDHDTRCHETAGAFARKTKTISRDLVYEVWQPTPPPARRTFMFDGTHRGCLDTPIVHI